MGVARARRFILLPGGWLKTIKFAVRQRPRNPGNNLGNNELYETVKNGQKRSPVGFQVSRCNCL